MTYGLRHCSRSAFVLSLIFSFLIITQFKFVALSVYLYAALGTMHDNVPIVLS
jgi:hypothetical protein